MQSNGMCGDAFYFGYNNNYLTIDNDRYVYTLASCHLNLRITDNKIILRVYDHVALKCIYEIWRFAHAIHKWNDDDNNN